MKSSYPELNVPLFFSVTGHRDIPKDLYKPLETHLTEYFATFNEMYENTEVFLLSALADGADRIVAKAAMNAGIEVIAVLPMPKDDYKRTFFENCGSDEEFEDLLSGTYNKDHPYVLPKLENGTSDLAEQYRRLGRFFVSHSHVLIALWDGRSPKADGGTSDVVAMARFGTDWSCKPAQEDKPLNVVDSCLVYWIKAPRNDVPSDWKLECQYIQPNNVPGCICSNIVENEEMTISSALPYYSAALFKRIEAMNEDSLENNNQRKKTEDFRIIADGVQKDVENRCSFYLLPDNSDVSEKIKDSKKMRVMAGRYALADRLAGKYQRISFFRKYVYLAFVVLSNFFLMAYLTFSTEMYLIVGYVLFLTASMLWFWHTVKRRRRLYHFRFLEYRQLAEIMRVYYYWALLGITPSASDLFREHVREPTNWVRNVMIGWTMDLLLTTDDTGLSDTEKASIAKDAWVEDQRCYHSRKRNTNAKRIGGLSAGERLLLLLSAGASVAIMSINFITPNIVDLEKIGVGIASTLILLSVAVFMTNIISRAMSTVRTSYIHGGSPSEIDLKLKMFEVASKRLERTLCQRDESGELSASASTRCEQIYYELGLLSIEECNEWAESHVVKDMPVLVMPGKSL